MTEREIIEQLKSLKSHCEDFRDGEDSVWAKDIEALDMAIEALEKQIPKKPRETRCALMCANCGHKITEKGCKKLNRNYCKKCGQRILWEVEE